MSLSARYFPVGPGESIVLGVDVSSVLPPGLGIEAASVSAVHNTDPVAAAPEVAFGAVGIRGRRCWASASGFIEGQDYQIRWAVSDSAGNQLPRTVLLLCQETS